MQDEDSDGLAACARSRLIPGVVAQYVTSTVVERTSGVSYCAALRGPRATEEKAALQRSVVVPSPFRAQR